MKTRMNVEGLMNEIAIIDFERRGFEQLTVQEKSSGIKIEKMDGETLAGVIGPKKYVVISTASGNSKTKGFCYELDVTDSSEIGKYMDALLQLPNIEDIGHVHIYPYNLFKNRRTK